MAEVCGTYEWSDDERRMVEKYGHLFIKRTGHRISNADIEDRMLDLDVSLSAVERAQSHPTGNVQNTTDQSRPLGAKSSSPKREDGPPLP